MCTGIETALTMASLAMGAVSAVGGGIASKQAGDANAAQLENAAKVEEIRAQQAMERAQSETMAFDRKAARELGAQRAQMAASGLSMGSGTLLSLGQDTAREMAIERQNIGYQGTLAAWGHMDEAGGLRRQAAYSQSAGNSGLATGLMGAGVSLLGSAGKVAGAAGRGGGGTPRTGKKLF